MPTFRYNCECGRRECKRKIELTQAQYERLSRVGLVLAKGCPARYKSRVA